MPIAPEKEITVCTRNSGKLIVATNARGRPRCWPVSSWRAETNGVEGILRAEARPRRSIWSRILSCTSALLSPKTGIIDSHSYMVALQGDAENAGAVLVFFSPVLGARVVGRKVEIDVGGDDPITLRCRLLVNSAGLHAPGLAGRITGMPPDRVPTA